MTADFTVDPNGSAAANKDLEGLIQRMSSIAAGSISGEVYQILNAYKTRAEKAERRAEKAEECLCSIRDVIDSAMPRQYRVRTPTEYSMSKSRRTFDAVEHGKISRVTFDNHVWEDLTWQDLRRNVVQILLREGRSLEEVKMTITGIRKGRHSRDPGCYYIESFDITIQNYGAHDVLRELLRTAQQHNRFFQLEIKQDPSHAGKNPLLDSGAAFKIELGQKPAQSAGNGISMFLTQSQKAELEKLGFTRVQIREMRPDEGHRLLGVVP